MKKIIIPLFILAILGACSANKAAVETEYKFANRLAAEGLFKEALMRWEKLLKEGKENAAIHNNIAVALEKMGRFDEAEASYKKALAISPNNPTIQNNYDKLKKYLKNEDEPEDPKDKTKDEDKKNKDEKEDEKPK